MPKPPPTPVRASHALLALALVSIAWVACSEGGAPRAPATIAYVDDAECARCHAKEVELWRGSHHDRAMEVASPTTLLGSFDGAPTETKSGPVAFGRRGEEFVVDAPGGGGPRRVTHAFGVEPLQQVLVELDRGRLQCATVAWDAREGHWFDLYPDDAFAPGDELAWTGRYQRWNTMCAQCHSTDVEKRYDAATDSYATRWSAIDVGCQACHGPGARHVELANAGRATKTQHGLVANLRAGAQKDQLDACGPCHALRTQITERWVHGEPFLDHFMPDLLRPGMYAADGQLEGEAYEWGSFLQSKMQARGVACSDCHEPHSSALRGNGDQVCTQCHQTSPPLNRFPTLKSKVYDGHDHTRHAPGSAGASCVACHMPSKTFMQIDERHDHSFRIPRPDLTVALGVPNTCTACHADKDAAWAAERVRELWPGAEHRPHWAQGIAAARQGDGRSLAKLVADPETPSIVKASALELHALAGLPPGVEFLDADDPLVRLGALRAMDGSPDRDPARWRAVLERLSDPLRAIRVEAARIAAGLDESSLGPDDRAAFEAAFAEFRAAQGAMADMPGAHLNLAVVHERRGEFADAEREYVLALELDPAFLPARFNLGQLLHRLKRSAEAERVFRAGIELVPDEGELHHSLGLLLAELRRPDEAAAALARAAELLPRDVQKQFDSAVAAVVAGKPEQAERAFERALELAPAAVEIVFAAAQHHASLGQWARALPHARKAAELRPGDPGVRELLQRVELELAGKSR